MDAPHVQPTSTVASRLSDRSQQLARDKVSPHVASGIAHVSRCLIDNFRLELISNSRAVRRSLDVGCVHALHPLAGDVRPRAAGVVSEVLFPMHSGQ